MLLLPLAAAIVMGGGLTMVGNSPLILLNDLLVAANANNLPSGAATLELLNMFAPMPIGLCLLAASLAYFHFFGSKRLRDEDGSRVTPARTAKLFRPRLRHRRRRLRAHRSAPTARWSG